LILFWQKYTNLLGAMYHIDKDPIVFSDARSYWVDKEAESLFGTTVTTVHKDQSLLRSVSESDLNKNRIDNRKVRIQLHDGALQIGLCQEQEEDRYVCTDCKDEIKVSEDKVVPKENRIVNKLGENLAKNIQDGYGKCSCSLEKDLKKSSLQRYVSTNTKAKATSEKSIFQHSIMKNFRNPSSPRVPKHNYPVEYSECCKSTSVVPQNREDRISKPMNDQLANNLQRSKNVFNAVQMGRKESRLTPANSKCPLPNERSHIRQLRRELNKVKLDYKNQMKSFQNMQSLVKHVEKKTESMGLKKPKIRDEDHAAVVKKQASVAVKIVPKYSSLQNSDPRCIAPQSEGNRYQEQIKEKEESIRCVEKDLLKLNRQGEGIILKFQEIEGRRAVLMKEYADLEKDFERNDGMSTRDQQKFEKHILDIMLKLKRDMLNSEKYMKAQNNLDAEITQQTEALQKLHVERNQLTAVNAEDDIEETLSKQSDESSQYTGTKTTFAEKLGATPREETRKVDDECEGEESLGQERKLTEFKSMHSSGEVKSSLREAFRISVVQARHQFQLGIGRDNQ